MSETYASVRFAFTHHAMTRCAEYFGEAPDVDEQWGMVRAIEAGKAPLVTSNKDRATRKRRPIFLLPWHRKETELAVVCDPTNYQVITVLRPDSFEVTRWKAKQAELVNVSSTASSEVNDD